MHYTPTQASKDVEQSNSRKGNTAVVYTRNLISNRGDPSQAQQNSRCLLYCNAQGISIKAHFCEKVSDLNQRPELHQAVKYCKNKKIDFMIVDNLGCIARSETDIEKINTVLLGYGTSILPANSPIHRNHYRELVESIFATLTSYKSSVHASATKNGMNTAKLHGRIVHRLPVGLRKIKSFTSIVHDPVTAPLVKQAFEMFATGDYSAQDIADDLSKKGLCNPSTGKHYSVQSIRRMLANPIYAGKIWINDKMCFVTTNFKSIVNENLFNLVQKILEKLN